MTMHMTRRVANGVAVLDLRGRLTEEAIEADSDRLRTVVAQLVEAGSAEIAVNLEGVTHLDAGGLGELVAALRAARAHGGRLALVASPPRVRRMLSITRLDTVFELFGSETELRSTFGSFGSFGSFGRSDRSGATAVPIGPEPLSSTLFA